MVNSDGLARICLIAVCLIGVCLVGLVFTASSDGAQDSRQPNEPTRRESSRRTFDEEYKLNRYREPAPQPPTNATALNSRQSYSGDRKVDQMADRVTTNSPTQSQKSDRGQSQQASFSQPANDLRVQPLRQHEALAAPRERPMVAHASVPPDVSEPEAKPFWPEDLRSPTDENSVDGRPSTTSRFGAGAIYPTITKIGSKTVWVLGLGLFSIILLKLAMFRKTGKLPNDQPMEIKKTLNIGVKACLHLVEIENKKVLVAVDANGIKSLEVLQESFSEFSEAIEEKEESPLKQGAAIQMKEFLERYITNQE